MAERAPDCTTPRAAAIAGVIAAAVMAGEMNIGEKQPEAVVRRMMQPMNVGDVAQYGKDAAEGFRVAGLMISARARASVRTPSQAALSGAEAALALAEDALGADPADDDELPDAHAVLASIRDALRAGLAPLHAAEGAGPAAA